MTLRSIRTSFLAVLSAALLAFPAWSPAQNSADQNNQPGATQQQSTPNATQDTQTGQTQTQTTHKHKKTSKKETGKSRAGSPSSQDQSPMNQPSSATQPAASLTIPAGTRLAVRMIDSVNSDVNKPGDQFHGTLDEDLTVNGQTVAPKGSDVYGRVVRIREGAINTLPSQEPNRNEPGSNEALPPGTATSPSPTSPSTTPPSTTPPPSTAAPSTTPPSSSAADNPPAVNPGAQSPVAPESQSAMKQSQSSMSQSQAQTQPTTSGTPAATAQTGDLSLVITELDINGQRHYLAAASPASISPGQSEVGQTKGEELTVVEANHGAAAVAVISSPSASVTTPGAAVGVGAGTVSQVVIKGERLQVPSQTVIEFRLQEPLTMSESPAPNFNDNNANQKPDWNK